jgi:hypothetical protein
MLKRVCSRRQIIINASPRPPSSPSTTSPRRTHLFPKKETECGCTNFSGACFMHVLLKTPTLKGMCITGKFITNPGRSPSSSTASPQSTPPSQRKNILSYLLPLLSFLCFINHILEYACVIFSIVESFAHKAPVAYN